MPRQRGSGGSGTPTQQRLAEKRLVVLPARPGSAVLPVWRDEEASNPRGKAEAGWLGLIKQLRK